MTTIQILMSLVLMLLAYQLVVTISQLCRQFDALYDNTIDYINKASGFNRYEGVQSYKMMELTRACAFGKERKRKYRHLYGTWKHKFGFMFDE